MRLVFASCLAVALVCSPGASGAATFLELDFDGVVGNGPDYAFGVIGDYITGNLWLVEDVYLTEAQEISAFDLGICEYEQELQFEAAEYFVPAGWGSLPVEGDLCVRVWAWDPDVTAAEEGSWGKVKALFRSGPGSLKAATASPITLPAKVGAMTYFLAVDWTIAEIVLETGTVTLPDGTTLPIENSGVILARVQIATL
ncbi:MAG: hypothetical protein EHM19_08990 [Candidatus Latescibacterota bacterium]|nr:MAG: hypothetical protein EHM19_08990 [Candidatus Latescibacterota bacterium]